MSAKKTEVARLLEAISEKLNANRPEIARSIAHGRINWRVKDGRIDVVLDLTL